MARISELHYSNAYAASSGIDEFLEVALSPDEDPADFTVAFYEADGAVGLVVDLTDPRVWVSYDAQANEYVYVLSSENLPLLLTDPDSNAAGNFEAAALVNSSTSEVLQFYDIGGGTTNITALNGPAAGAVSENIPVPTEPNAATYTIQFNQPNPDTVTLTTVNPASSGMICFASGTMITTPLGERPVEDLQVGDLVLTLDSGARPIRWIGAREVEATGEMAPIRFAPGALGAERELLVSPQHRMLVSSADLELATGSCEALVAAKHLVNGRDVARQEGGTVTYHHFMFDQHELVWANGVPAESFLVASNSVSAMTPEMLAEFKALFPELITDHARQGDLARPVLRGWEARAMFGLAA
ncbi:Hint domain-containing protein [Tropicimonas aquimaris]|uniref:Hint domain-containing protein n=1 Tax=Tropicimonas aquimaris TaxID=914152 RepID=A0ABW3IQV6_9RHOB